MLSARFFAPLAAPAIFFCVLFSKPVAAGEKMDPAGIYGSSSLPPGYYDGGLQTNITGTEPYTIPQDGPAFTDPLAPTQPPAAVPEPATLTLLVVGASALAIRSRRAGRKSHSSA